MSNPLIDKFYELHPEKKEKPKEEEPMGYVQLSKEQRDIVSKYLTDPKNYSKTSVTAPTQPTSAVNYNAAANPYISKFISYDTHSGNDSFLQIAEKVKNGDARVTYVTMNTEKFIRTITFEVQVYDAP